MENQQQQPLPEEPNNQAAPAWHAPMFQALLDVFGEDVNFLRLTQEQNPNNNIISWMHGNERFFMSWYEIPPDEYKFIQDNTVDPDGALITLDKSVLIDAKVN